jgi:protein FAM50
MNQEFSDSGRRSRLIAARQEKISKEVAEERAKSQKSLEVRIKSERFVPQQLDIEAELKRDTVGLVKLDEFQRIRESIEQRQVKDEGAEKRKAAKKTKIDRVKLSFDDDDGEDIVGVFCMRNV